jgi:mRNA interferase MazF
MDYPKRGEIWIVSLEPVKGHEMGKTRPALVISNDINNRLCGNDNCSPDNI